MCDFSERGILSPLLPFASKTACITLTLVAKVFSTLSFHRISNLSIAGNAERREAKSLLRASSWLDYRVTESFSFLGVKVEPFVEVGWELGIWAVGRLDWLQAELILHMER